MSKVNKLQELKNAAHDKIMDICRTVVTPENLEEAKVEIGQAKAVNTHCLRVIQFKLHNVTQEDYV